MKIKMFEDEKKIGQQVVLDLQEILQEKPNPLVCVAGGSTTLPIMKEIVDAHQKDKLSLSRVNFISLDEWGGLDINVKGSCAQTLYDNLFNPLEVSKKNIFFFNGKSDLEKETKKADEFIQKNNGIDYIILGVGMNGHVGFNEPGIFQEDGAMVVDLDEVTKEVMCKYFEEKIEIKQGVTLSLKQLSLAKKMVLIITGSHKKKILQKTIETAADPMFPVSMLKKDSNNLSLYLDNSVYDN